MGQDCRGTDYVFPVPDNWVERSMIGYAAPPAPDKKLAPNILVATNQMPSDEMLDSFVTRQVADLQSRAQGFALKLRRDARLDGVACVEIVFALQGGEAGRIQQRQVYVQRPGGRVLSITHTAPEAEFAACDEVFLTMLRQFAWTQDAAA